MVSMIGWSLAWVLRSTTTTVRRASIGSLGYDLQE